jgi:hypothetical protein
LISGQSGKPERGDFKGKLRGNALKMTI